MIGTSHNDGRVTMHRGRLCAVLTGDIVGSTSLREIDPRAAIPAMTRASEELRTALYDQMPLEVDNFGGDSWQAYLTSPRRALWAALFYRAWLLSSSPSVDTRIAIGIGSADYVPEHRVSEGQGEAFDISGRLLRSMAKTPHMRLGCADETRRVTWDAVAQLVDYIVVANWTPPRARAMTGALRDWKQQDIGSLWGARAIKQASVSKLLGKAGWSAISAAVAAFDESWRE